MNDAAIPFARCTFLKALQACGLILTLAALLQASANAQSTPVRLPESFAALSAIKFEDAVKEKQKEAKMKGMKKSKTVTGDSPNQITLLRDADGDGNFELREVLLEGLNQPFGMALVGDSRCSSPTPMRCSPFPGQTKIDGKPRKGWLVASSNHPGGILMLSCDGSVSDVANTVDFGIWQAFATRDGGLPHSPTMSWGQPQHVIGRGAGTTSCCVHSGTMKASVPVKKNRRRQASSERSPRRATGQASAGVGPLWAAGAAQ